MYRVCRNVISHVIMHVFCCLFYDVFLRESIYFFQRVYFTTFEADVLVKADKLPDVFFLYRFEGISTGLPTPFSPTPVCPIYILRV